MSANPPMLPPSTTKPAALGLKWPDPKPGEVALTGPSPLPTLELNPVTEPAMKKLQLNKETLGLLRPESLDHLAGGIRVAESKGCPPPTGNGTCYISCYAICELK